MKNSDFRKLILNIISEWLFVEEDNPTSQFIRNRLFEPNEYIIRSAESPNNNFHKDLYEIYTLINDTNTLNELHKIYNNHMLFANNEKQNFHLNTYKILFKLFTFTPYLIFNISQKKPSFNAIKNDTFLDIYHYTTVESCNLIEASNELRLRNRGFNDYEEKVPENVFIASFSLLEDHPTLWRLYGDNTKGVCMHFKLNISRKSPDTFPFFVLYDHKHFDCFITEIEEMSRGLEEMKTFLNDFIGLARKSIDYKDEHEIRIAYNENNPEPTIVKSLSLLGLELKEIIVGSNCKKKLLTTLLKTKKSNFKLNIG